MVPTRQGESFFRNGDGDFWRTFIFVEGVQTFEAVQTRSKPSKPGEAFGDFQSLLVDLPGGRLHETIPDFHNTRKRFNALVTSRGKRSFQSRQGSRARKLNSPSSTNPSSMSFSMQMAKKKIPERITHNDTKFNNVMLDCTTGEAMCVVDLDTVMPGCALYDFGDMVRTTTSPTLEDERDLSKVKMQMPMFKKLAEGYYRTAGQFSHRPRKSLVAFSGKLITFEIGVRFLTDYLSGDTYFRIHRPGHNLDRCRTQFKLVESIEKQEEAMQKFVDGL